MPSFSLLLNIRLDNVSPRTRSELRLGEELSSRLPVLLAEAMNTVAKANRNELKATGEDWPVYGKVLDPRFCFNVPQFTVIVTMNPVYNGFDFTSRREALYREFLHLVWGFVVERGDGHGSPCDIRIEWGDAMGGGFDAAGSIRGEYGGSAGISQLRA